ncbi:hypothetical protein B0T16DRAFT_325190 [Cercophora newfieldiana]|uniref:Rhodopsin domain-containing protein n=1 Tax=Cercophora newfieldiana TaxID=92897 RepID=A0AA39YE66_9PEZI|nr:hypothetical protein B0T16DRAFT_325190 [Cercophora newfieldiana]
MASPVGIGDRSAETNAAIWVLVSASGIFLSLRLWLRQRSAKLWWDDLVLTVSWVILLIGAALISRIITVGTKTGDDKRFFFLLQNTSVTLTTLAISWTKVAFALTLTRIARHKIQLWFLWFIIVTANLVLIPGILSTWVPACGDPRARFRPVNYMCYDLNILQYLGSATMTYMGVIDILLALFPWFVLRTVQLQTREKIGLTIAMSLGAITGVFVVIRVFLQVVQGDFNFDFMIFISIFAFLEPCVAIILQVVPIFRVFIIRVKRDISQKSKLHISPPTSPLNSLQSRDTSVASKPRSRLEMEEEDWDGRSLNHPYSRPLEHKFGEDRRFYNLRV